MITEIRKAGKDAAQTGRWGTGGNNSYSVGWLAKSDDPTDDAAIVAAYFESQGHIVGLSPYPNDPAAVLDGIAPKRDAQSIEDWRVTLTYATPQRDEQPRVDKDGNPTDEPQLWRWEHSVGHATFQVAVWKAWNETAFPHPASDPAGAGGSYVRPKGTLGPVVNSAGVPYDPPITRDHLEWIWQVTLFDIVYDTPEEELYLNSINSHSMDFSQEIQDDYEFLPKLFLPFSVLCSGWQGTFRRWKAIGYWEVQLEFRARPWNEIVHGWLVSLLDRGLSGRRAAGDPDGRGNSVQQQDLLDGMAIHAPILAPDGNRVAEPVLLDGRGEPLKDLADETSGFYFDWRVHEKRNFREILYPLFGPP